MNLSQLVPRLKEFNTILVTGPQRSGTTIGAKILAHELHYDYIDESEIGIDDVGQTFDLYRTRQRFVLQAPGLAAYCHLLPPAVVFMHRPIEEIRRSQERIQWPFEGYELHKYFREEGLIAEVKYLVWESYQAKRPGRFCLDYHGLEEHPLFVPSERREHFHSRQWSEACET